MKKSLFAKSAAILGIISIFALSGILIFQLNIAFGWSNPIGNPPTGNGAVSAVSGNTEINTSFTSNQAAASLKITPKTVSGLPVQPAIDVSGALISGVGAPQSGTDAVNRDYVDAASSKGTITIYGIGAPAGVPVTPGPPSGNPYKPGSFAWFNSGAAQKFGNCLIGNYENCGTTPFTGPIFSGGGGLPGYPAPGAGVSCPSGYTSIFAGYGPYAFTDRQYVYDGSSAGGGWAGGNPNFSSPTDSDQTTADNNNISHLDSPIRSRVALTYSHCGTATEQVVKTDYTKIVVYNIGGLDPTQSGTGAVAGMASACVPQNDIFQMPNVHYYVCNTCRICEKQ